MNTHPGNSDSEAFLPQGMEIEGTVKSDRPLTINGKIRGKVESSSQVLVGETGEVDADVQCGRLEVYGRINGEVTASEHVGLFRGGKLLGKINTPSLQTEAGAFFKGVVEMTEGDQTTIITSTPKKPMISNIPLVNNPEVKLPVPPKAS